MTLEPNQTSGRERQTGHLALVNSSDTVEARGATVKRLLQRTILLWLLLA